jgi:hypothetical protein
MNAAKSCRTRAAKVTGTVAPIVERPLHVLLAENIGNRANSGLIIGLNARNIAGLLEGLSESGFQEASARKDEWQKAWWEQAGYLADVIRREAYDLQGELQAIEQLAEQIARGAP